MVRQNLLAYSFDTSLPLVLNIKFLEVHPELIRFLEQRGEYITQNRVKICTGSQFRLGAPDELTGNPQSIIIANLEQYQSHAIGFPNSEFRDRYAKGMRTALSYLCLAFQGRSSPYIVTL